ncbi:hypothetical protein CR513_14914, partial [Mucuna pruriens]
MFSHPPLNTNWAALFKEACSIDLITLSPAPKRRLAHGANKTKYCCYHQNYDHTTEEFLTLRDKIEELIHANALPEENKCLRGNGRLDESKRCGVKAPQDSKAPSTP